MNTYCSWKRTWSETLWINYDCKLKRLSSDNLFFRIFVSFLQFIVWFCSCIATSCVVIRFQQPFHCFCFSYFDRVRRIRIFFSFKIYNYRAMLNISNEKHIIFNKVVFIVLHSMKDNYSNKLLHYMYNIWNIVGLCTCNVNRRMNVDKWWRIAIKQFKKIRWQTNRWDNVSFIGLNRKTYRSRLMK